MKKLFLLVLVCAFTLSCSSDDSSIVYSESSLIGKWYLSGGSINGGLFEPYIHDCSEKKDFQEFFATHKLTFNSYDSTCDLTDTETSDWKLSGDKLTISSTNFDPMIYSYEYVIKKLTSTELILEMSAKTPEGIILMQTKFVK